MSKVTEQEALETIGKLVREVQELRQLLRETRLHLPYNPSDPDGLYSRVKKAVAA